MEYKFIFKGHLDFGNKRAFDSVTNMYEWKVTNHYKKDVQFDSEELFDTEKHSAVFPRSLVLHGTPKNFEANSSLLDYLSEYAITGQMEMWMIGESGVKSYKLVEPTGDRAAISSFTKGRELSVSEGRTQEALAALDEAIQKYEHHAQAYERRAHVNVMLHKFHDAERDYTKSIKIYAGMPEPYYGRGMLYRSQGKHEEALKDFDTAIKRSIPLQPIHWKSRRRKAQVLVQLEDFDMASKELRFFTNRNFDKENPNYKYLRRAYYDYGYCLYETGKYKEANQQIELALKLEEGKDAPSMEEMLFHRGMCRMKAGFSNFEKDIKQAAKAGYPKAQEVLDEVS